MEGEKEEEPSAVTRTAYALGDGARGACQGGLGQWRGEALEAHTDV